MFVVIATGGLKLIPIFLLWLWGWQKNLNMLTNHSPSTPSPPTSTQPCSYVASGCGQLESKPKLLSYNLSKLKVFLRHFLSLWSKFGIFLDFIGWCVAWNVEWMDWNSPRVLSPPKNQNAIDWLVQAKYVRHKNIRILTNKQKTSPRSMQSEDPHRRKKNSLDLNPLTILTKYSGVGATWVAFNMELGTFVGIHHCMWKSLLGNILHKENVAHTI